MLSVVFLSVTGSFFDKMSVKHTCLNNHSLSVSLSCKNGVKRRKASSSVCRRRDGVRQPSCRHVCQSTFGVFCISSRRILKKTCFQSSNLIKLIIFTAPARKFLCETGFFAHHNCSDKYSDFWFPLVPPAQFTRSHRKFYPPLFLHHCGSPHKKAASISVLSPKRLDFVYHWEALWEP